jgi:hypothetical protein
VHNVTLYLLVVENPLFRIESNINFTYSLNGDKSKSALDQMPRLNEYHDDYLLETPFACSLAEQDKIPFLSQLTRDVAFLESQNLVDYRLLVGVALNHHEFGPMEKGYYLHDRRTKRPNVFYNKDEDCLCVVTIVNITNDFGMKKKMKNFMSSLLFWSEELLAYDPPNYGKRFVESTKEYFQLREAIQLEI